jgi:hypothetical protein
MSQSSAKNHSVLSLIKILLVIVLNNTQKTNNKFEIVMSKFESLLNYKMLKIFII